MVTHKPTTFRSCSVLWRLPKSTQYCERVHTITLDLLTLSHSSQVSYQERCVLCLILVCPGTLLRTSRPATEPFRLIIQQSVREQWQWQGHVYNITRIWNSHNNIIDNKIWKIIQPFKKPQIAKKKHQMRKQWMYSDNLTRSQS